MIFNNLSLEEILYRLPAVFIGFTFHEFMHAYVSDKLGDPTPRNEGRVSLNPIVHIDWLGFILLLIAGFGWAKPVNTNPRYYKNYKKGRILVSIAGPLANLSLAFVGLAVFYYGYDLIAANKFWLNLIYQFNAINIVLFAFNFIPIPPLDGFTLLEMSINPAKFQTINNFRQYGIFILLILSFTGILSKYIGFIYGVVYYASTWIFGGIDKLIGLFM